MKQKFTLCAFSRHTLAAGLLFPFAVCAVYVAGLLLGFVHTEFRYDTLCLIRLTAETFAACAVVAIACAFLGDYLYRHGRS